MQLTIKTLKGETFIVQVQPNNTILELKNKVKQAKGFEIESQKIVFKGKATNNTDQLQKIGIKEGDFLVIMTLVKKPQPKKVEQAIKKQQTKVEDAQKKQQKEKQEKVEKKQQKESEQQQKLKKEFDQKVNSLMGMGFPKDQCQQALRAAYLNEDRAVEYLCNGIPQVSQQPQGQGSVPGMGAGLLSGLINSPQFSQIRDMIRNDPTSIQPMLQQLQQTSPQLYNLIAQHPEQFEQMILEGQDDGQYQGEEGEAPPGSILISAQDEAAINRLSALGFPKIQAAQAYMACDKNQELAANLLFDRQANGEFDMQGEDFPEQGGNDGGDDDDNLFN